MDYPRHFGLLTIYIALLLWAVPYVTAHSEAFAELHNVMINSRNNRNSNARSLLIPRTWDENSVPQTESVSPLAAVKRALLGRQTLSCDPGYSLCRASQRCCPDSYGRCCDDGTCLKEGQTCCLNGGGACSAGYTCCSASTCAPKGGECCSNGQSCDPGLHCVIFRGALRCCENLQCTGNNIGGPVPVPSVSSFSVTPISVTPLSFTPLTFTSVSVPSITIPPITLPSITAPPVTIPTPAAPPASVGNNYVYIYYTTTWTYYFYYYFMTTIPPGITSPTSTRHSTSISFSVYATDLPQASRQFRSITADVPVPTAVTAPGYTNRVFSATRTSSSTTPLGAGGGGSAATGSTGPSANFSGFVGGGVGRGENSGKLLRVICLSSGLGLLAVWL